MTRGPKQSVLWALSRIRLQDGQALLKTGQPGRRGRAIYIAGYGIECALKAQICRDRGGAYLDGSYFHHSLHRLAEATSRWPAIVADARLLSRLTYLEAQWEVSMRYEARAYNPDDVRVFISRAKEFVQWLSED